MIDISPAIEPRSDQLNADCLIGKTKTIRIRDVVVRKGQEQPMSIYFDGDDNKPWKPCRQMARLMAHVWGGEDGAVWIGKSLTLHRDPTVTYGNAAVGGIRITHMSNIDKSVTVYLTATKTKRVPYTVEPLIVEQPKPQPTQKQPAPDIEKEAKQAAERGMDDLKEFWAQLTKQQQKALSPYMAKLKETASAADAANAEDDAHETAPVPTSVARNEAASAPTLAASSSIEDMEF